MSIFCGDLDALEEGAAEVRPAVILSPSWNVTSSRNSSRQAQAILGQLPFGDQLGDELELRVLIERLVEHQLEQRLRVRRETLVGVPARDVARPADGDGVGVGGERDQLSVNTPPPTTPRPSICNSVRRSISIVICFPLVAVVSSTDAITARPRWPRPRISKTKYLKLKMDTVCAQQVGLPRREKSRQILPPFSADSLRRQPRPSHREMRVGAGKARKLAIMGA